MKNKIVSTIKTSAGELKLSEDAFCKHTIFIGSTGSGKTTSLNVLLRDIIGYNAEDEKQKVGLLVFDLKGDNHHILDKSFFTKKGTPTISVSKEKHFELQCLLAKATTLQGYMDYEQAVKAECPEIQDPIAQIYWQRIESLHTPWRIRLSVWAKKRFPSVRFR